MTKVLVTGSFDNLRSRHLRFLEEASKFGDLQVQLWTDETAQAVCGTAPTFPQQERLYLLEAVRCVDRVEMVALADRQAAVACAQRAQADVWVIDGQDENAGTWAQGERHGMETHILDDQDLAGFPVMSTDPEGDSRARKRAIVTGCFDWFHSGHVRFFEEVSQWGDLYVIVGHDANIRLLKGDGHPMFSQDERRYVVQSIRHVKQALISTGHGWMDAAPEIDRLKPDAYVVNEDGDQPEKRQFCQQHGLEYVMLKRIPKEGLRKRESTALRGF